MNRERGMYRSSGNPTGYYNGGRGGYRSREEEDEWLDQKLREANHRMEDSSLRCVRTLHETMQIANETSEHLERQAESLDRTEDNLDRMAIDLESSKRNMREVKSVFGSFVNRFSKPKYSNEPITTHKKRNELPPSAVAKQQQVQTSKKSTGNETVDRNLDEVELCLKQLEGQAHLMGHQLDESNETLERIRVKMDKNDIKMKSVTREAKRQL